MVLMGAKNMITKNVKMMLQHVCIAISSNMAKLEMAKTIHLQMWKSFDIWLEKKTFAIWTPYGNVCQRTHFD